MGPFYCPNDRRIYLDTSFFREIETRFHGCHGKACEFSQAYVIAHEVGHHVQNLLGMLPKANARRSAPPATARRPTASRCGSNCRPIALPASGRNRSDSAQSFLDPGDIDAALQTASAIGDDTLQRQRARPRRAGRVHPRLGRAAQALVHHRLHARHTIGLRHFRGGRGYKGTHARHRRSRANSCR